MTSSMSILLNTVIFSLGFLLTSCTGNNTTGTNFLDIAYGDEAQRNQFPYQVSIQEEIYGHTFHHICSGAILRPKWIITTAYCIQNSKYLLRIIAGALLPNDTQASVQIVPVGKVITHPNYTGEISENDIALLKLKSSLAFSKAVLSISIQPQNIEIMEGAAVNSGWSIYRQGFEKSRLNKLSYFITSILSYADCVDALRQSDVSPQKVLCAEQVPGELLYCPGESGNTLTYGGYLVGLTSWGISRCGITVYTKVPMFADFIRQHIVRKRPIKNK